MTYSKEDKIRVYRKLFPINMAAMIVADVMALILMLLYASDLVSKFEMVLVIVLGNLSAQITIFQLPQFFEIKKKTGDNNDAR